MNSNTIVGLSSGTSRNQIPSLALATVTETSVKVTTDTGTAVALLGLPLATAVVGSSNPLSQNANPAILSPALGAAFQGAGTNRPYFNSTSFSGRTLRARISGTGVAGANAAQSVIVNLYLGTNIVTPSSNTLLATTGAALATVAGGAFSFSLVADLLWDSGTLLVVGSQTGTIAFGTTQQYTVPKAIAAVPSAVALAGIQFQASVVMGNAAASTVQVSEFAIDVL